MICFELQCSEALQTAHTTIFPYTTDGVPFWMRYYCCLPNFGRCQALRRRVDQLYSSKLHERFRSRCSCKPESGSSDWFKVRIGRIFQNIFMSTSGRWHVIIKAVLLGAHLARMHSMTWSMSFPMRVSRTGLAARCASFLHLAPKRTQHWPGLRQIE